MRRDGTRHGIGCHHVIRTELVLGFQLALPLGHNGGRQHAKYVSTPGGYSGLPIVGSSVAQIPKWTSSVTVGYRHGIVTNLDGFANLSYQGQTGGTQDATTAATSRRRASGV